MVSNARLWVSATNLPGAASQDGGSAGDVEKHPGVHNTSSQGIGGGITGSGGDKCARSQAELGCRGGLHLANHVTGVNDPGEFVLVQAETVTQLIRPGAMLGIGKPRKMDKGVIDKCLVERQTGQPPAT